MMAYKFREIAPETYQVEDYTIIKDGSGEWKVTPEVTSVRLEKAIRNFTNAIDNE